MARIRNVGSLNPDLVYRVDSFVQPGEPKLSRSLEMHGGGKRLNQFVAAARADASAWHADSLGTLGKWGGWR